VGGVIRAAPSTDSERRPRPGAVRERRHLFYPSRTVLSNARWRRNGDCSNSSSEERCQIQLAQPEGGAGGGAEGEVQLLGGGLEHHGLHGRGPWLTASHLLVDVGEGELRAGERLFEGGIAAAGLVRRQLVGAEMVGANDQPLSEWRTIRLRVVTSKTAARLGSHRVRMPWRTPSGDAAETWTPLRLIYRTSACRTGANIPGRARNHAGV
jgi:hypothetical protein